MALTYAEFALIVQSDRDKVRRREPPDGVAKCPECAVPLMESVTGNRRLGDGRHVCSDCYFELWGNEIDDHPLLTPQLVRGS
jgi:hypothetical protein